MLRRKRFIGAGVIGGSVAATLFYDTFTGSDGTLLPAHTPDTDVVGGGWVELPTVGSDTVVIDIFNNKSRIRNQAGRGKIAVANVNKSDVTITYSVTWATSTFPGVAVRSNALTLTNNRHFAVLLGNNLLNIYEFTGSSSYTLRASAALSLTNGQTYALTVTVSGTLISGQVGAVNVQYNSSNYQTNTRFGLADASGAVTTTSGDNFKVVG